MAALIIALLVLGTALTIYQLGLGRQQLAYKSAKEVLLSISSDFDRALTHALAEASQTYNDTLPAGLDVSAREGLRAGNSFVSNWTRSVMTAHPNLGLQMQASPPPGISAPFSDFYFDWYSKPAEGESLAISNFAVNLTGYGVTGWHTDKNRGVELTLYPDSLKHHGGSTTFDFRVVDLIGLETRPVPNLAGEDIVALKVELYPGGLGWFDARDYVRPLDYKGGGNYTIEVALSISDFTKGIKMMVQTPDDGILVAAQNIGEPVVWNLTSREETDNSFNLGWITLGTLTYDLPARWSEAGHSSPYYLSYWPEDWGYEFVKWEYSGPVYIEDLTSWETDVTVTGPGNVDITAVYRPGGISLEYGLGVDSRYEDTGSGHVDSRQGNVTVENTDTGTSWTSPIFPSLVPGVQPLESYTVEFEFLRPPNPRGLEFYRWEATTGVWPLNRGIRPEFWPWANPSRVQVIGNGSVIAVYTKPLRLTLNSEFVQLTGETRPDNLGKITLDSQEYDLPVPNLKNVRAGVHDLEYTVENESYVFYGWRVSDEGSAYIYVNSTPTVLRLTGDAVITALYALRGELEHPPPGGTFYIDSKPGPPVLLPYPPDDSGHIHPFSTGNEKGWVNVTSDPILGNVTVANPAIVTLFLRTNPPENAKFVYAELGFWFSEDYYELGHDNQTFTGQTPIYTFEIDTSNAPQVPGYRPRQIPAGSTIQLAVVITWEHQPWGTLFLYFGGIYLSRAEVYDVVQLVVQTDPPWPGVRFTIDPGKETYAEGTTGSDGNVSFIVERGTHVVEALDPSITTEDTRLWLTGQWMIQPPNQMITSELDWCAVSLAYDGILTVNYDPEYYLDVVSEVNGVEIGGPGGEGWYEEGTSTRATLTEGLVYNGSHTRYVFTSWDGDASGFELESLYIWMDSPKVAFANWVTQHALNLSAEDQFDFNATPPVYLSVLGQPFYDHGSLVWYEEGTLVSVTVPANATLPYTTLYRFDHLSVDDVTQTAYSVDPLDGRLTFNVTMDAPHNATAHYIRQYNLTLLTNVTALTLNVTAPDLSYRLVSLPYTDWYNARLAVGISGPMNVMITGTWYDFLYAKNEVGDTLEVNVSGGTWSLKYPLVMDGSHTVTAYYLTRP